MKKKKIKRPHELVLVKWFDTYSCDKWLMIDEAREWGINRLIIHSVGWLIDETKNHVLLAGGYSDEGAAHLLVHIPKSNIIQKIKIDLHN